MARTKQTQRDNTATNADTWLCGVCNKTVVYKDPTKPYIANCDVCGKSNYIHGSRNCANMLYKLTPQGQKDNTNKLVSSAKFNEMESCGLYCQSCRVNCFICNEDHVYGMYEYKIFSILASVIII